MFEEFDLGQNKAIASFAEGNSGVDGWSLGLISRIASEDGSRAVSV